MHTDELDFDLPPDLIAQAPPEKRDQSRLLHYRRADRAIAHRGFHELPELLEAGDLLVFNNVRVLPARFALRKETGGRIEGLFLRELSPGVWGVLLKGLERYAGGLHFEAEPSISAGMIRSLGEGEYELKIGSSEPAAALLERIGRMPLPPYIRREKGHDERDELDRERYQTVFASRPGAVAAPTAALHFSDSLLAEIEARGIQRTFVTLEVGMGTFKPVTAGNLEHHVMHVENFAIDQPAADALNLARREKRRIIAVGTTSARVLESHPAGQPFVPRSGSTGIFIRPPYKWKHCDALITNFHLPRSTLIALVAAFVGLDEQRRIYQKAIAERYRFFSYGDAMLLE